MKNSDDIPVSDPDLQDLDAVDPLDEFSQRVGSSYLVGVYLAANAISDIRIVVEGPDCTYMKAQYVQGNHDMMSTLTSVSGYHRLVNTALHPAGMTGSREGPLSKLMLEAAEEPSTPAVLLTSMPMAFITGADYERLCQQVRDKTGKQAIHIRGLSLQGDWLDGYAETLRSLADQIDLPDPALDPRKVAVVGYLWDRNEYDHHANFAQLKEMCSVLGLDLVSMWLSGKSFADLKRVSEAGTIVSLPYGRKAARTLARRTGAKLIELPLPFGLKGTETWMRTLGETFGVLPAAERYIDGKLSSIIPRLEWVIPFVCENLKVGWAGDPHLLAGTLDILEILGMQLTLGVVLNRGIHTREVQDLIDRHGILVWPRQREFQKAVSKSMQKEKISLAISAGGALTGSGKDYAFVEFGFPSLYFHALSDRPFLGFDGFIAFVDRVVNTLRTSEVALNMPVSPEGEGSSGQTDPTAGGRGMHTA
jgi:nitrogenase molybdenum-iron protein alpha/beta subunit